MINQLVNSIPPAENTYKILIIMQAKQNIFEGIGKLPRHSKPEGPRSWLERDLEEWTWHFVPLIPPWHLHLSSYDWEADEQKRWPENVHCKGNGKQTIIVQSPSEWGRMSKHSKLSVLILKGNTLGKR